MILKIKFITPSKFTKNNTSKFVPGLPMTTYYNPCEVCRSLVPRTATKRDGGDGEIGVLEIPPSRPRQMSARGGIGRGGRGAYYKNLYGGRGRGKPPLNPSTPSTSTSLDGHTSPSTDSLARGPAELGTILGTKDHFEQELARIDGKPYGAYKDLKGFLLQL